MEVGDRHDTAAPNGDQVDHLAADPPETKTAEIERRGRGRFVGPFDLRGTWQVLAGAVLAGLGFAAMLLGYSGAARTPLVEEQVPYLISGGVIGLALVVLGGFLFWAHWLFRQYERSEYHQHRRFELSVDATDRTLAALEAVRAEVEALRNGSAVAGGGPTPTIDTLVAAEGDDIIHSAGCPLLASKPAVRPVEDSEFGRFRPCPICEPAISSSSQRPARKPQKRTSVRRRSTPLRDRTGDGDHSSL